PYAQWHYPFENKEMIDPPSLKLRRTSPAAPQFPADFIVEAIDQTRGWFYTLLAISTLLGKGLAYKNVLVHGHVLDEKGQKMSKSKGNVVSPFEVMDKFGVDAARWYFYTLNSPDDYKLFSIKDVELRFKGFITTLDNCVRFWELYGGQLKDYELRITHSELTRNPQSAIKKLNLLDRWILSKISGLVAEVTEKLDKYDPTSASRAIEKFVVDDFSNWWLRRSRKRKEALGLLRFVLLELAKIIAPFTPFLAENIHGRLHKGQNAGTESVHLHDWPKANKKLVDKKLEEEMEKVRKIVAVGLASRKEKQIKVRQPLAKLSLREFSIFNFQFSSQLLDLIKEELNVKEVVFDNSQKETVVLDTELTPTLIYEGYARELMRQIQDMRKEARYRLDDKVFGQWHSDDEDLSEAINQWSDEIKNEVLLSEFSNGPHDGKAYDIEKELELAPQKKIWIGVRTRK
ncbi:MAG: class I tRNA ligase family protein, partial [Patescibacteria group bacterium]